MLITTLEIGLTRTTEQQIAQKERSQNIIEHKKKKKNKHKHKNKTNNHKHKEWKHKHLNKNNLTTNRRKGKISEYEFLFIHSCQLLRTLNGFHQCRVWISAEFDKILPVRKFLFDCLSKSTLPLVPFHCLTKAKVMHLCPFSFLLSHFLGLL